MMDAFDMLAKNAEIVGNIFAETRGRLIGRLELSREGVEIIIDETARAGIPYEERYHCKHIVQWPRLVSASIDVLQMSIADALREIEFYISKRKCPPAPITAVDITKHAATRAYERLQEVGLSPETFLTGIFDGIPYLNCWTSAAILMTTLEEQHNQPWGDRSNGDEVWAIIRDGALVTLMLRRSTQPKTPWALKVRKVFLRYARRAVK